MGYEIDNGCGNGFNHGEDWCEKGNLCKSCTIKFNLTKENTRLQQLNDALNEIDDTAGSWRKLALDMHKMAQAMHQELAAAECETMGDHAPFFKAKIEGFADRIKEVEG